jgi:creatinine amidohydrolase
VTSLLDLPHTAARRLLASGAPVFVPVNPVEYHGPHLSLHNDGLVSAGLIRDLHARLAPDLPLLSIADLEVGVEPAPGPGSRPVPYPVVRDLVRRTCAALADLGARRVVLVTFHGHPLHSWALQAGVRLLARRGVPAVAPFNALMQEMLTADGADHAVAYAHVEDPAERAAMIATLPEDFHAGFFETSVALHYAPESVDPVYATLPPCPSIGVSPAIRALTRVLGRRRLGRELHFAGLGLGWAALRPFPGYTGRPHRASAASGRYFAGLLVDRFAACATAVFEGRAASPAPILGWLPAATLGGRLGRTRIPLASVQG